MRTSLQRFLRPIRPYAIAGFITVYLSALGFGLFAHTFNFATGCHPMMYFVVWDMFCGWSAYDTRFYAIAEGIDGTYYNVLPGPWGDFEPHGEISRQHYDPDAIFCGRMALNVLRHTQHEEITRVFVVEEAWSKKYNMPDDQWAARFEEEKDPYRYYRVRNIITPEGTLLQAQDGWLNHQANLAIMSNPRLAADYQRSRPFMAVNLNSGSPAPVSDMSGFSKVRTALSN